MGLRKCEGVLQWTKCHRIGGQHKLAALGGIKRPATKPPRGIKQVHLQQCHGGRFHKMHRRFACDGYHIRIPRHQALDRVTIATVIDDKISTRPPMSVPKINRLGGLTCAICCSERHTKPVHAPAGTTFRKINNHRYLLACFLLSCRELEHIWVQQVRYCIVGAAINQPPNRNTFLIAVDNSLPDVKAMRNTEINALSGTGHGSVR